MLTAPFGSWKSPITSDLIVSNSINIKQVFIDGENIYWTESRPLENGRSVIVQRDKNGQLQDITPSSFNVRTLVHEYGGGDFVVSDGIIYFSNFLDQRIYKQIEGSDPLPITFEENLRYADGIIDQHRNKLISVREDHSDNSKEPINTIVSVNLDEPYTNNILVYGKDFYSSPKLSPNGKTLAWLSWNHPNMPWDGTELWIGEVQKDGTLSNFKLIAGGIQESIFQPEWSPDGILHFVSDRNGWWNLYRWIDEKTEILCKMEAEFGEPQWNFGMSTYGFESKEKIICTYHDKYGYQLAKLDITSAQLSPIETPYSEISNLQIGNGKAFFIGGSPKIFPSLISLDLQTNQLDVLRCSNSLEINPDYLSIPKLIEFPTEDNQISYAFFYPPKNCDFTGQANELPPLLVKSHGGPTGVASSTLNLKIQYWTSRGFAVVDVNYGGSTGYGRAYRERLRWKWGIVDVADCVSAAMYLVEQGLVDYNKSAISGGSAGGYTTLCALTFRNIFKVGASHYGVSDLKILEDDSHKFESKYGNSLIGPYPEQVKLYEERSPINFVDQINCPIIFFQGLEDKVVPPNQSELIVNALRRNGIPVAYITFEGEQHGFRQAKNIKCSLDGEFYFYSQIFDFIPADYIEPIFIENFLKINSN